MADTLGEILAEVGTTLHNQVTAEGSVSAMSATVLSDGRVRVSTITFVSGVLAQGDGLEPSE